MKKIMVFTAAIVLCSVVIIILACEVTRLDIENEKQREQYIEALDGAEEALSERNGIYGQLLVAQARIAELEEHSFPVGESFCFSQKGETKKRELFDLHTNMFRGMDYRTITDTASDQYKLQQAAMTRHNGIRAIQCGGEYYYCAALGGAFGYNIGDAWNVTLRNGYRFGVILSDFKHPIPQTEEERQAALTDYGDDDENYFGDKCLSVIEFVIDIDAVPDSVRQAGTLTAIPAFGGLYSYDGDIVEMEYAGRLWSR